MGLMRALPAAAVVSIVVAGSALTATSAHAAPEATQGTTSLIFSHNVTTNFFANNVFVFGQDPAGGTVAGVGKFAFELPVATSKDSKVTHEGALSFSHSGFRGWRTAVLRYVTWDFAKGTVSGNVWGTDHMYKNKTIFTLTHVRDEGSSVSFTLKLAPHAAGFLNKILDTWVFTEGMRLGSGFNAPASS